MDVNSVNDETFSSRKRTLTSTTQNQRSRAQVLVDMTLQIRLQPIDIFFSPLQKHTQMYSSILVVGDNVKLRAIFQTWC